MLSCPTRSKPNANFCKSGYIPKCPAIPEKCIFGRLFYRAKKPYSQTENRPVSVKLNERFSSGETTSQNAIDKKESVT
jgi:hypothetical protein